MDIIEHLIYPDCRILQTDALTGLRSLPDASVHVCVTSPPYYGLRDYGLPPIDWDEGTYVPMAGLSPVEYSSWNGCLGLEPTPEMFVGHLVQIFAEVWRVLRPDGTLWVNLGDSFNGSGGAGGDYAEGGLKAGQPKYPGRHIGTLKPKNMLGMPWRLAFALQAFGWYLRMDNIWNKENPKPSPATDRTVLSHEYVFHFSKNKNYYFDSIAIQEPAKTITPEKLTFRRLPRKGITPNPNAKVNEHRPDRLDTLPTGFRNRRSVWTLPVSTFKGAHFATYHPDLVRLAVMGSTSPRTCSECGTPWHSDEDFIPGCRCKNKDGRHPAVVLDPFSGSGTTGQVALEEGRAYVGIEMNPQYVALHRKRIRARQITLEQMASQEEPTSTLAQADLGI